MAENGEPCSVGRLAFLAQARRMSSLADESELRKLHLTSWGEGCGGACVKCRHRSNLLCTSPLTFSEPLREVDCMGCPMRHPVLPPHFIRSDDARGPRTGQPIITFEDVLRERDMLGDLQSVLGDTSAAAALAGPGVAAEPLA